MKVDPKSIKQYENVDDPDHCVVNIFEFYFSRIPQRDGQFYYRPLPNAADGLPKFANQPVGHNTLSKIIPNICKAVGIVGNKTGHSGKVTCATTLYHAISKISLLKKELAIVLLKLFISINVPVLINRRLFLGLSNLLKYTIKKMLILMLKMMTSSHPRKKIKEMKLEDLLSNPGHSNSFTNCTFNFKINEYLITDSFLFKKLYSSILIAMCIK